MGEGSGGEGEGARGGEVGLSVEGAGVGDPPVHPHPFDTTAIIYSFEEQTI